MKDIRRVADAAETALKVQGATKYNLAVSETQTREFNAENGEFSLFRTVLSNSAAARVFLDGRMGSSSRNDISNEGLESMARDAVSAARSGEEDSAYDIAPDQGRETFRQGVYDPDMDRFFERIKELLEDIERDYPRIAVMLMMGSHTRAHTLYRNTNGTEFEEYAGFYDFGLEFAARDGEKVTSIDYAGLTLTDLGTPFIEQGSIRRHLQDTEDSLEAVALKGKFTGTLLFTPECLGSFLGMIMGNFASDGVILDGTSLWLDKVGQQVAGKSLTVSFRSGDPRIAAADMYTSDGFRSEDTVFIENGTLKTHLLSLYAANKTGRPVTKNACSAMIVEPGGKSFTELIAQTKRGLLVGGFSGGQPGANGEFSGVAKNSFLIEDGKISGAVTETMINGNLGDIIMDIEGISKEVLCDGNSVLPYLAVGGAVISGK